MQSDWPPHRGRPAFSLATSWESPAPKVGCLGAAGTRARAASAVPPLWSKGASVPVTADICGCQGVGRATPRRQHATSAFHVPASDTFVRSISLRFDAFAKQCQRLPSFGALDFLPAEGILHSSATPDAAHVPWGRETSPAEGPGRGPCPLADPTYPRTSKEMSPCSSVSALSTIRRSVSIFSDVEHPGLYQMPPPTSKP